MEALHKDHNFDFETHELPQSQTAAVYKVNRHDMDMPVTAMSTWQLHTDPLLLADSDCHDHVLRTSTSAHCTVLTAGSP